MRKIILLILFVAAIQLVSAQENLSAQEKIAVKLAQQQLEAYNSRNIIDFLKPFSDDIKAYNYPDQLLFEGKDSMREVYGKMFANSPDLHCKLVNRIVMGNTIIDQEKVTGVAGAENKTIEALAIYTIADNRIIEVRFVSK